MSRWIVFLAFTIVLLLVHIGHARKMVIFGHGGDALQEWMTLKIIDIHKEHRQGFSPIIRKTSSPRFQREALRFEDLDHGVSQSFICDTCLDISTFVEQVLTDPDTMGSVLDYINGSLCKAIYGFQEECASMAKIYVPELVETLQVYAAPDKLCGETKLCPSSAMLLLNEAQTCKMCTDFATEALSHIQDSKTETEIMDALHSQCSKLGGFSEKCNMFVDTYVPLYIGKVDSVTPEQVCQKVGMCKSHSIKDPSHCATCEFAVFQLKAKLRNPVVQQKILEELLDGCTKVPAHADQCKEIVRQYGPFILANMDTYVDPESICTEIHACESKKQPTNYDSLIQLPVGMHRVAHE